MNFLHGRNVLHLDNPNPDESETISKPIQIYPNIGLDWTPKSGSCTPLLPNPWLLVWLGWITVNLRHLPP